MLRYDGESCLKRSPLLYFEGVVDDKELYLIKILALETLKSKQCKN